MNFLGKIDNGKLLFNSLDWVKQKIKDFEGRRFTLTIHEPKRSLSQNSYYWGAYLPLIAEHTGHSTEGLHAHFKKKFLPREYETVFGVETELEKSTTGLTKSEFTEYIMRIEAETEVPAPNPEDAGYIVNRKVVE